MTPTEFLAQIVPAAQASMRETKIPASVVIAQAILESSWGKSKLAIEAHNLFGVKADKAWLGPIATMPTTEYTNGVPGVVMAKWRSYPDWLACIEDHAAFLMRNPRYAPCWLAANGEGWAHALQAAGYATDPAYPDKLIEVIRGRSLMQYD